MNTAEQEIRTLRKKAKSWLAILTYYSAQGKVNLDILSQRLQSLFRPVLKPEIIRETIRNAIPTALNKKDTAGIKKRIVSRLTPGKVERRMLDYSLAIGRKNLAQKKNAFTLGRFVIIWAILTYQSTQEFLIKVIPGINRIYRDWHKATGCSGLSDEECRSHPRESARFWSGFLRILIQETPEENLINFIQGGIQALGAVVEMPGLDKKFYDLLGQATRLVTKETAKRIKSALKENPYAGERINVPELKALVIREEARLGWSKNADEGTLKTLRESLSPELKKGVDKTDEVIKSSIEAIGRRGLFNNLLDTLNGKLRPRFIESIIRFLKAIMRVESRWEFDISNVTKEGSGSIRRWLFRR